MPSISFGEFFAEINGSHQPFAWQQRLVDYVLESGVWPAQIVAPTGTGKSSVVDVHLYLNIVHALGEGPRVPRRLSVVVNRRALVDNQAEHATKILQQMKDAKEGSLLARAAGALRSLRSTNAEDPFIVGHLRGALSNRTLPVNYPEACAVIAATPDMWGSRALFRGYGSGRLARPRETAIFTMDNVLVLDESHLNRQLLLTARRIAQLQEKESDLGVPRLQVVAATATSTEELGASSVGVDEADFSVDPVIAQRIDSNKALELHAVEKWNGKPKNAAVINMAVEEVLRLKEGAAGTVGCIVNHVDTATKIHQLLKKKGLKSEILVGRMRPHDVDRMKARHPGLFSIEGASEVDVLVATQTMEVGIDVDFCHLVTELAPGSSLAQRFGRVNRLGRRMDSQISVLVPAEEGLIKDDCPPYAKQDLIDSLAWLNQLEEIGSANPRQMLSNPAPGESPTRLLFQRLEWADVHNLCRTTDELFDESDLSLWLRDSLDAELPLGGVVVRSPLPEDTNAAVELLNVVKPRDEETFPANILVLNMLKELLAPDDVTAYKMEKQSPGKRIRAFLFRDDEVVLLSHHESLRPTDILIIEPGTHFTTEGVATNKPEDTEAIQPVPLPGIEVHVFNSEMSHQEAERFAELAEQYFGDILENPSKKNSIKGFQCSSMIIETDHRFNFVPVVPWYVTESDDAVKSEEESIQVWTPSNGAVLLADHQRDVADLTNSMCTRLGIDDSFRHIVVDAAAHHDDGKSDSRFQAWLNGGRPNIDGPPLAKSGLRSRQEIRRTKNLAGVPPKWRHEQLSALKVACDVGFDTPERELMLRIVGCSHGHGRSTFPHSNCEVLDPTAGEDAKSIAQQLFLEGEWDDIISRTNRNVGPYAMAYLEAIERAADAVVSSDGR